MKTKPSVFSYEQLQELEMVNEMNEFYLSFLGSYPINMLTAYELYYCS